MTHNQLHLSSINETNLEWKYEKYKKSEKLMRAGRQETYNICFVAF